MVDREELQRLAKEVEALRQQLDEIQNRTQQIDGILEEHDVTNGILGAYIDTQRKSLTHIPIGSGVCLKVMIDPDNPPLTLVDIGSGMYGEKNLEDARALTQKRKEDIKELRDELASQGTQIEQKLGEVASLFNSTAERFKNEQNEKTPAPTSTAPPTPPPQKKRTPLFKQELTLDD